VARYYLDEHVGDAITTPLSARGHDALSTHQAGSKGLSDPRQVLFASADGRILVTFNARHFVMLHEMLVLSTALADSPSSRLHAGIALLPSSSRMPTAQLVTALDELPRFVEEPANRCFRWIPATGWEEVIVAPFDPTRQASG
jgi:hypothetical protein